MSATDVIAGGGGSVAVQTFFQTGNEYSFQVAGTPLLPVDGTFHDLVVPLSSITDRQNVQTFGVNLGSHTNDVVINVDLVRFELAQVYGDYNNNGVVDAGDYVVWRRNLGTSFQLPNEATSTTPGSVTQEDYAAWRARFGNTAATAGSGSLANSASVPEPASVVLVMFALAAGLAAVTNHRNPRPGIRLFLEIGS
jgi:hypothetical protein